MKAQPPQVRRKGHVTGTNVTRYQTEPRTGCEKPDPHTHTHHRCTTNVTPSSTHGARTDDTLANELWHVMNFAETQSGAPNSEVLLDKELHGFRVVLVRTPVMESHQVTLTPRELEIARMIGKRLPNKMIANVLDISTWTVRTHLRRMFTKLSSFTCGHDREALRPTIVFFRAGSLPREARLTTKGIGM